MIPRGPRKNVAFIVCKGLQLASRAVAKEGVFIKDFHGLVKWHTCDGQGYVQMIQLSFNLILSVINLV